MGREEMARVGHPGEEKKERDAEDFGVADAEVATMPAIHSGLSPRETRRVFVKRVH